MRDHFDVYFFELYYINMIKHHHADHPSNTFVVGEGNLQFKFWREKVYATEQQLISALSRCIVNNYPMTKHLSFSMKYRDFSVKSKPIILLFQTMKIRLLDFHRLELPFLLYFSEFSAKSLAQILLLLIIIIISLFQEDNIFGTNASIGNNNRYSHGIYR